MKKNLLFSKWALLGGVTISVIGAFVFYQEVDPLQGNIFPKTSEEASQKPQDEIVLPVNTSSAKLILVSPKADSADIMGRQPISFQWDAPVFSLENPESVSKKLMESITMTPEHKGAWKMLGTSGLVFDPKEAWNASTRYEITLPQTLVPQAIDYAFETPRLKLTSVQASDLIFKKPLVLSFDQEVALDEIQELEIYPSLEFDLEYGEEQVYDVKKKESVSRLSKKKVVLIPRDDWSSATSYSLILSVGTTSLEGPLPTLQSQRKSFQTIQPLTLKSHEPENVFQPLTIQASADVRVGEFLAQVSFAPDVEEAVWESYLTEHFPEDEREEFRSHFSFPPIGQAYWDPKTSYRLTVKKDLQDIYKRSLLSNFKSDSFQVKFPTTFEKVFLPESNSVFAPDAEWNPLFWYSGDMHSTEVQFQRMMPDPTELFTHTEKLESSFEGERFRSLDLKEIFPQEDLLNDQDELQSGCYFFKLKALGKTLPRGNIFRRMNQSSREYNRQFQTTFCVSDFVVEMQKLSDSSHRVVVRSFPGDEGELPQDFVLESYEVKTYGAFKERAELKFKHDFSSSETVFKSTESLRAVLVRAEGLIGVGGHDFQKPFDSSRSQDQISINPYFYKNSSQKGRSVAWSDRPLYRPGQTVYFKGLFRNLQSFGKHFPLLSVAADEPPRTWHIRVQGPQYNEIGTFKAMSFEGAWNTDWKIPKDAPHGEYRVNISTSNMDGASISFYVGDFRKPNILVDLSASVDRVLPGESVTLSVLGNYAFGGPLKGKKVTYQIEQTQTQHCDIYRHASYDRINPCENTPLEIKSGEGVLDAEGRFDIHFKVDEREDDTFKKGTIRASVTVEASVQESSSQNLEIPFEPADARIHFDPIKSLFLAQKEVTFTGKVTNLDGDPLVDKEVTSELWKDPDWWGWGKMARQPSQKIQTGVPMMTDSEGAWSTTFTLPQEGGRYRWVTGTVDQEGRPTSADVSFWVAGARRSVQTEKESFTPQMITDKDQYEIGDIALVSLMHDLTSITFSRVTIERGEVFETLDLDGETGTVSFPIEPWMEPNVFVTFLVEGLNGSGDSTVRQGSVEIPVYNSDRELDIDLQPTQEQYRPGDRVKINLQTNVGGKGVAAEVTVMVVDETLLQLRSPQALDLLKTFLAKVPLGIETYHTLYKFIPQTTLDKVSEEIESIELYAQQNSAMSRSGGRNMMFKSEMAVMGSAMADGVMMEESLAQAAPGGNTITTRKDFQDTAAFFATVRTDASGAGVFEFDLPDNLTTWKVQVVGSTQDNAFGESEATIQTSLPLLVSEILPNFFQMGDEVSVGVLIRREVDAISEEKVLVRIALPEGFETEKRVKVVEVGEEARVFFPLTIPREGWSLEDDFHEVEIGFTVQTDSGLSDGVTRTNKLYPPKVQLSSADFWRIEDQITLSIKPDLGRSITSKLLVKTFLSLVSRLEALVDITDQHNYGCTEQTFTRWTGILAQKDFDQKLQKMSPLIDQEKLQEARDHVEEAFIQNQGYAFWKSSSRPSLWVTANVLEFAPLWEQFEMRLNQDHLLTARAWMASQILRKCQPTDYKYCFSDTTRQHAGYILARDGLLTPKDLGWLQSYLKPIEAKVWWLKSARMLEERGEVLSESFHQQKALIWEDLDRLMKLESRYAFWEEGRGYRSFYSQQERLTALVFEEFVRREDRKMLHSKVVRYLSETSTEFFSGNTALRVLRVLGDYAMEREVENQGAEFAITLQSKGGVISLAEDTLVTLESEKDYVIDLKKNPVESIDFQEKNKKPYYGDVVLQETFRAEDLAPVSRGFWIERKIHALEDEFFEEEQTELKVGEYYVVRLLVSTSQSHRQVMVESPIPSGAEIVNFDFENTDQSLKSLASAGGGSGNNYCYGWCRPQFVHQEFHHEKARYFADYMGSGVYEIKYLIRTRLPGSFEVLPSKVEEMYYPEVFATTDGMGVVIEGE